MMGKAKPPQGKFFYTGFRLEERVREDHPLRVIRKLVDFDFTYREVKGRYGYNGNVSVPPPVILKLMFLLFYYDVASERELMATLPERLDWLWFLDYDLDDDIPDHSVLSKARKRWGVEVFRRLFVRVVEQCIALGLVDGRRIYCDASLVDANAANDSIKGTWLRVACDKLEQKLSDVGEEEEVESERTQKYTSTTDSDAAVVPGRGGARARFKTHRSVDGRCGVVTATKITPGDVNEAHLLAGLLEQHEATTERRVETVVADSKYGTIENYLHCHDRKVKAHMPDIKQRTATSGRKGGIFPDSEFTYCEKDDEYICPAGKRLKRKRFHVGRQSYDYCGSKKLCGNCPLRQQCTTSEHGRSIKRHMRQEDIDRMRKETKSWQARADLRRRKHVAEGSFADAAQNHGLKRARWRGLGRVAIQDYLIAAVQNIRIMVKTHLRRALSGVGVMLRPAFSVGQDDSYCGLGSIWCLQELKLNLSSICTNCCPPHIT